MPHSTQSSEDSADASWLVDLLFHLHSASRKLRRLVEESVVPQSLDMGPLVEHELLLLWACSEPNSEQSQRELAESLGISPPQISALVERLRSQGDLTCERSRNDRRRQVLRLTEQGTARLEEALAQLAPHASHLASHFAPPIRAGLADALGTLASASTTSASTTSTISSMPIAPPASATPTSLVSGAAA